MRGPEFNVFTHNVIQANVRQARNLKPERTTSNIDQITEVAFLPTTLKFFLSPFGTRRYNICICHTRYRSQKQNMICPDICSCLVYTWARSPSALRPTGTICIVTIQHQTS